VTPRGIPRTSRHERKKKKKEGREREERVVIKKKREEKEKERGKKRGTLAGISLLLIVRPIGKRARGRAIVFRAVSIYPTA